MRKLVLFLVFLSTGTWADTPYKDSEIISEVHILNPQNQRNVIQPSRDNSKHFYHFAVKSEDTKERFNILVMKGERVVELRVDDLHSELITDAQVSGPQDNSSTSFAGRAELNSALIEAQAYQEQRNGITQNSVSSTQAYRLFRINVETLEIFPVLQQSINLVMTNKTIMDPMAFNMDYRPIAAGVYVKKKLNKKQSLRFSATGGSGINLRMDTKNNIVPMALGTVDLKFAIDL